ncbi:uncharacterized protein LOC122010804 [Zingiber officinale]|uniref:uncharacterized protein LOC122010804 n=1 Tax=Zingiber officinale TaxID=94328 RepID=UPI001C4B6EC8|nr:uncharacterized protein LOC122010804 [Zingiber officinale]
MKAPQNLKEAQKLVDRITALSRFISQSADRSVPFFKVLRKASEFQWDEECIRAFEELKKYLETLPSLFKPITGEPLWVYLSATPETVGAVLVKEQDNGSGVGVLLISPQEDILQLVVRLNFRATNNEAEYEALLVGLQAARHVGAARVIIYSDSQLVTQQVTGNFEINCDKLQVYREAYEKMKEEFKEVTIELQNNQDEIINWRTPMISYLQQGTLPTNLEQA